MNIGMDKRSPYYMLVGPSDSYRLIDIQSVFGVFYRYLKYESLENENGLASLVLNAVRSANQSCVDIGHDADNEFLRCIQSENRHNQAEFEAVFAARKINSLKEKVTFMYQNMILNKVARNTAIRAFSRLFLKIRSGSNLKIRSGSKWTRTSHN